MVRPPAADEELLARMCDVLIHRGPDEYGYRIDGDAAIGLRRLSIIDLTSGRQPVHNEDRTVFVVQNGEIYNFAELRATLEGRGHLFETGTDTECIAHLYEEYGDDCVSHLRGMFAFALWDAKRRRLLLARDRAGKKPLYYRLDAGGILFASELKAIMQDPTFERRVDPVALHHYLTYQYVPAPWSIFQGVAKLPPAHVLVFEAGRARIHRYWRLSYGPKVEMSDGEAAERLQELIDECTALRMVSDRPLGAFLSGGIDSSVVVAAMAAQSAQPVRTFTIGFDDPAFDERQAARSVAECLGTEHHDLVVRPSALGVLPAMTWHYDEPFADWSAIPSWYLAEMTAREVTVALNGDGGDEDFGGYSRYLRYLKLSRVPAPSWLSALVDAVPPPRLGRGLGATAARARRGLRLACLDRGARYAEMMAVFNSQAKRSLYTKDMADAVAGIDSSELVAGALDETESGDLLDQVLSVDVETYLHGDLLVKMDRATMAHSLEARSPFLDHHLMEFAASLPSSTKVRGASAKYLLKAVARRRLPEAIISRPKQGFGVPMGDWLRHELRDLSHDALGDRAVANRGYFDPASVRRLLREHDAGIDRGAQIWALLQFELWMQTFLDVDRVDPPAAVTR